MGRLSKEAESALRMDIEARLRAGESAVKIAYVLGCSRNTVADVRQAMPIEQGAQLGASSGQITEQGAQLNRGAQLPIEQGAHLDASAGQLTEHPAQLSRGAQLAIEQAVNHTHQVGDQVEFMGIKRPVTKVNADGSYGLGWQGAWTLATPKPLLESALPDCCTGLSADVRFARSRAAGYVIDG